MAPTKGSCATACLHGKMLMSKHGLTKAEHQIVAKLGECMNEFATLKHWDVSKDGDCREFATFVHVLQRAVMCRAAQREHPKHYQRGRHI